MRALACLVILLGAACQIDKQTTVEETTTKQDPAKLIEQAAQLKESDPKSAFELASKAARATPADDPERYERLCLAAQYGIRLAVLRIEAAEHARQAILLCNTAAGIEPERVDAFHYRSIAIGMFAEQKSAYGPDAMKEIQLDARHAAKLDETFDSAGPRRVLGALYLRAPGPPTGVGSVRRALRELERAVEIAPDHLENLLFLAEALAKAERDPDRVRVLLDGVDLLLATVENDYDRQRWSEHAATIRADLNRPGLE